MTDLSRFFAYAHLPQHLQEVSQPVAQLASVMRDVLPDNEERAVGMRKLLEAKDCFVRAALSLPAARLIPPLDNDAAKYRDLLQRLGVQGHAGAIAEIDNLRKSSLLDFGLVLCR